MGPIGVETVSFRCTSKTSSEWTPPPPTAKEKSERRTVTESTGVTTTFIT